MKPFFNLKQCCSLSTSALITSALILLGSLFTATASASDNYSTQPVTLYQHVQFRGSSLVVGEGEVSIGDLRRSRVRNDRISSIRIASGFEVYACQHSGLRGRCETFTSDTPDLRQINFNDVISSLVVRNTLAPVTVFQHVNFRGNALSVGEGEVTIGDLRNSSVGNDRISSIRVAPGYEVLACQHSRLRGRCETFTNDTSDLRNIHFNDVISSLTVQPVSSPNSPPVVSENLEVTTSADSIVEFSVLPVVSDPDEDTLTYTSLRDSNLPGTLTDDGAGNFTFDPQGAFGNLLIGETATQSFDYEVSDEIATTTGTITITIEGTTAPTANTPPVASDLQFTTNAEEVLAISVQQAVADADGNSLQFLPASGLTPDIGVLTDNGDGTYTFDPAGMFTESAWVSFDYTVSDGFDTATATVTIDVVVEEESAFTFIELTTSGLRNSTLNNAGEVIWNSNSLETLFRFDGTTTESFAIDRLNTDNGLLQLAVDIELNDNGDIIFLYGGFDPFQIISLDDDGGLTELVSSSSQITNTSIANNGVVNYVTFNSPAGSNGIRQLTDQGSVLLGTSQGFVFDADLYAVNNVGGVVWVDQGPDQLFYYDGVQTNAITTPSGSRFNSLDLNDNGDIVWIARDDITGPFQSAIYLLNSNANTFTSIGSGSFFGIGPVDINNAGQVAWQADDSIFLYDNGNVEILYTAEEDDKFQTISFRDLILNENGQVAWSLFMTNDTNDQLQQILVYSDGSVSLAETTTVGINSILTLEGFNDNNQILIREDSSLRLGTESP